LCLSAPPGTRYVGVPEAKLQLHPKDAPSRIIRCDNCTFLEVIRRWPSPSPEDKNRIELIRLARLDGQRCFAPSTRVKYWTYIHGADGFITFEHEVLGGTRIVPRYAGEPVSVDGLVMWMEHLARSGGREGKGRSASTLRSASAAVASFVTDARAGLSPFDEFPQPRRVLEGILRRIGSSSDQQLPISLEVLKEFTSALLEAQPPDFVARRTALQHLIHFLGGYRGSEVYSLLASDVRVYREGEYTPSGIKITRDTEHIEILLRGSKTDQRTHVLRTVIAARTASFDVLSLVVDYMEDRRALGIPTDAPLFLKDDNTTPMTNEYYRDRVLRPALRTLKATGFRGLQAAAVKDFGTHSMRIGYATSAREAEVHADIIENHGRWSWVRHRMVKHYGSFSLRNLIAATRPL